MMRTNQNQDEYQREYDQGQSHVKEQGYTQVQKLDDGGKVTKTYESKTITTKYGDNGEVLIDGQDS